MCFYDTLDLHSEGHREIRPDFMFMYPSIATGTVGVQKGLG